LVDGRLQNKKDEDLLFFRSSRDILLQQRGNREIAFKFDPNCPDGQSRGSDGINSSTIKVQKLDTTSSINKLDTDVPAVYSAMRGADPVSGSRLSFSDPKVNLNAGGGVAGTGSRADKVVNKMEDKVHQTTKMSPRRARSESPRGVAARRSGTSGTSFAGAGVNTTSSNGGNTTKNKPGDTLLCPARPSVDGDLEWKKWKAEHGLHETPLGSPPPGGFQLPRTPPRQHLSPKMTISVDHRQHHGVPPGVGGFGPQVGVIHDEDSGVDPQRAQHHQRPNDDQLDSHTAASTEKSMTPDEALKPQSWWTGGDNYAAPTLLHSRHSTPLDAKRQNNSKFSENRGGHHHHHHHQQRQYRGGARSQSTELNQREHDHMNVDLERPAPAHVDPRSGSGRRDERTDHHQHARAVGFKQPKGQNNLLSPPTTGSSTEISSRGSFFQAVTQRLRNRSPYYNSSKRDSSYDYFDDRNESNSDDHDGNHDHPPANSVYNSIAAAVQAFAAGVAAEANRCYYARSAAELRLRQPALPRLTTFKKLGHDAAGEQEKAPFSSVLFFAEGKHMDMEPNKSGTSMSSEEQLPSLANSSSGGELATVLEDLEEDHPVFVEGSHNRANNPADEKYFPQEYHVEKDHKHHRRGDGGHRHDDRHGPRADRMTPRAANSAAWTGLADEDAIRREREQLRRLERKHKGGSPPRASSPLSDGGKAITAATASLWQQCSASCEAFFWRPGFEPLVCAFLLLNMLHLLIEYDWPADQTPRSAHIAFRGIDLGFFVLFHLEFLLRLNAARAQGRRPPIVPAPGQEQQPEEDEEEQKNFFTFKELASSFPLLFDLAILVLAWATEIIVPIALFQGLFGETRFAALEAAGCVHLFAVLRILRLVRILRLFTVSELLFAATKRLYKTFHALAGWLLLSFVFYAVAALVTVTAVGRNEDILGQVAVSGSASSTSSTAPSTEDVFHDELPLESALARLSRSSTALLSLFKMLIFSDNALYDVQTLFRTEAWTIVWFFAVGFLGLLVLLNTVADFFTNSARFPPASLAAAEGGGGGEHKNADPLFKIPAHQLQAQHRPSASVVGEGVPVNYYVAGGGGRGPAWPVANFKKPSTPPGYRTAVATHQQEQPFAGAREEHQSMEPVIGILHEEFRSVLEVLTGDEDHWDELEAHLAKRRQSSTGSAVHLDGGGTSAGAASMKTLRGASTTKSASQKTAPGEVDLLGAQISRLAFERKWKGSPYLVQLLDTSASQATTAAKVGTYGTKSLELSPAVADDRLFDLFLCTQHDLPSGGHHQEVVAAEAFLDAYVKLRQMSLDPKQHAVLRLCKDGKQRYKRVLTVLRGSGGTGPAGGPMRGSGGF